MRVVPLQAAVLTSVSANLCYPPPGKSEVTASNTDRSVVQEHRQASNHSLTVQLQVCTHGSSQSRHLPLVVGGSCSWLLGRVPPSCTPTCNPPDCPSECQDPSTPKLRAAAEVDQLLSPSGTSDAVIDGPSSR